LAGDREDGLPVLVTVDEQWTAAGLAAGTLSCPSCRAGRLAPWGYARERTVWLAGGKRARVRPRRARCRACHRTCVLLPAWCAPRRAYAIEVIGAAAAATAFGYGSAAIGSWLGVPAGTLRGWLRRLRARAGQLRGYALGELAVFGGDRYDYLLPAGSPLADALAAVSAVLAAVRRRLGCGPELTAALIGRFGFCRFLQPARAG
jgi:hypothetical protein